MKFISTSKNGYLSISLEEFLKAILTPNKKGEHWIPSTYSMFSTQSGNVLLGEHVDVGLYLEHTQKKPPKTHVNVENINKNMYACFNFKHNINNNDFESYEDFKKIFINIDNKNIILEQIIPKIKRELYLKIIIIENIIKKITLNIENEKLKTLNKNKKQGQTQRKTITQNRLIAQP